MVKLACFLFVRCGALWKGVGGRYLHLRRSFCGRWVEKPALSSVDAWGVGRRIEQHCAAVRVQMKTARKEREDVYCRVRHCTAQKSFKNDDRSPSRACHNILCRRSSLQLDEYA